MNTKRKRQLIKTVKKTGMKFISGFMAIVMVHTSIYFPLDSLALSGGPSQPEVESFEPVGTSQMVDPFTGDFTYNIPLLDVDGYPVNLAYHSGITMDQEASWTGLGWNVNVGSIVRGIRGLPDDFKGELVTKEQNRKPNKTYGARWGGGLEIFGLDANQTGIGPSLSLGYSVGVNYNNYLGMGTEMSISPSFSIVKPGQGKLNFGLGLTSNSNDGLAIQPSVSASATLAKMEDSETSLSAGVGFGASMNSRVGLQSMSFNSSLSTSKKMDHKGKKKEVSSSGNIVAGSFDMGQPTYTPRISMSMKSFNASGRFTAGSELFGTHGNAFINGYYSRHGLLKTSSENPAYGYMHSDEGQKYDNSLMDFNRENDGGFTAQTPTLPLTNFTYDILSVSGQGVGGSYRPFRSEVGYVFDNRSTSQSNSVNVGAEVGFGNLFHAGGQVAIVDVNTTSGKWNYQNNAAPALPYRSNKPYRDYEAYYMKEANDRSVVSDDDFFASMGGDQAVRLAIDSSINYNTRLLDELEADNQTRYPLNQNYRDAREKRNQVISMLSKRELDAGYGIADLPSGAYAAASAPDHHVAQVSTVKPDGSRYIFGLPAYNYFKKEVTFAVGQKLDGSQLVNYPQSPNCQTGLISYANGDNSLQNGWGIDNYFNAITTPAHAHAYMLTAVLSPDYVDADNIKGPSDGDLGSYTKFSYKQITNYKWRTPMGDHLAAYNEGLKADPQDDKASYVYGEKELWYLDKIETPNYVAIFHTSDRDDACAVTGEDGAINTSKSMQKLDRISLFTKQDYLANGLAGTPVKEVHFEYDYSLCPNVPNNKNYNSSTGMGPGKLTLKKVYFTYRDSHRGRYSPYEFEYADTDFNQVADVNYPYNIKGYDRWGGYQPNVPTSCAGLAPLSTAEYPYTVQDKSLQDQYAAAWNLTAMNLPSGGRIQVSYEADDYGYIQHKRAMQMHQIIGVGDNINAINYGGDNDIENPQAVAVSESSNKNKYLFFKLQDQTTPISEYFQGVDNVYFRCLMEYNRNGNKLYDYVSGYAELGPGTAQTVTINNPNTSQTEVVGVVKLKSVSLSDGGNPDYNPIALAGVQFGRLYLSRIVWDQSGIDEGAGFGAAILNAMINTYANFINGFKNPNQYQYNQEQGTRLVLNKSWMRLNNVTGFKLGGGSRVKQLTIHDNWSQMTGNAENDFYYGQEFDYTMEENGHTVSSGVASYEPLIGGDENPWKQPVSFQAKNRLAPDDRFYQETPFGEMFMPSPSVGYSQVTIRNLQHQNVTRHATGKTVQQFYTARDFPVILSRTDLVHTRDKRDPFSITSLFNVDSRDHMTATQGFAIEVNDMHGKLKAHYSYAEGENTPISSMEYAYASSPYLSNSNRLVNSADIIQPNGDVEQGEIGVFFDMVSDFREQKTIMNAPTLHLNLETFMIGPFPVFVPPIFGTTARDETQFRSASTTKVIQRFGRLEKTVAKDRGSKVETKNLAYDAITGNVLLTEAVNNFDDPVYSLTYPAHWYYEGMGAASQNIDFEADQLTFNANGMASYSGASQYFFPGDEVAITSAANQGLYWVAEVNANSLVIIDADGQPLVGTHDIKVIRSGFRNRLDANMASMISLTNPLNGLSNNLFENVLSTQVVEYGDAWNTYCECFTDVNGDPTTTNPWFTGEKGNFRPLKSYTHLTGRAQTKENNNSDLRRDGVYTSYRPFYKLNPNQHWSIDRGDWTYTSEVTELNPFGLTMESRDALGNFNAVLYSYNQTLPISSGDNAQHRELGFDSFEDYDVASCADQHFRFDDATVQLSQEEAHSGHTSIKVGQGAPATLTRALPGYDCHPDECLLELNHIEKMGSTGSMNLLVTPVYGQGPYQVSWNVISGTPAISLNGANGVLTVELNGTYLLEVIVTDANGCEASHYYKVESGQLLAVI